MSVDRGRVRATWLLAGSCLDHLPQARQPSSTLETLPGLAASRLVPCGACGARGRVSKPGVPCAKCPPLTSPQRGSELPFRTGHGCTPCSLCEGTGWRPRRKSDPEVDAYAGALVPSTDDPQDVSVGAIRRALEAEKERPEIREAALARATRIVQASERPESVRFRWEEQWERMCSHGSYKELMVALEVLRQREAERYRIIWHNVCLDEGWELSAGRLSFLNESMAVLASLMPEQIKTPYWLRESRRNRDKKDSLWRGRSPAHERERRERDAEIVRLRVEEGWKTERLCRHFALSRAHIKRLIAAARVEEGSRE